MNDPFKTLQQIDAQLSSAQFSSAQISLSDSKWGKRVSKCKVWFETLQQIDAQVTNRREGWVGLQQKGRTLKFPVPTVAKGTNCAGEARREAMWAKPGTSDDTRQGWFPGEGWGAPPLHECLFFLLCSALLPSSSVRFNFPR